MSEQPNLQAGRHQLVDGVLTRGKDGIDANCICGWYSRGHFTRLSASAAFQEHREDPASLPSSSSLEERAAQNGVKLGDKFPDGRGPIQEEYREMLNDLALTLDDIFNPLPPGVLPAHRVRKIGFFLTCFEFENATGRFNYISNANRLDVKTMLRDIVARIEERERQAGEAKP